MAEQRTPLEQQSPPGRVGMAIGSKRGKLTVVRTSAGGPAERAGIRAGDQIVRIGEAEAADLGRKRAAALLRGAAGTGFTLWVARPGTSELLRFDVTREVDASATLPRGTGRFMLGLIGALGLAAAITWLAWSSTSDHRRAAEAYVALLREGNLQSAYRLLTAERRIALPYETWRESMHTPLLVRSRELEVGSTGSNSTGRGCVRASVLVDGTRIYLTFFTLAEGEDVHIHGVMTNEEQSGPIERGPWSCSVSVP